MESGAQRVVLTSDDYQHFPDDGRRWELLGGEAFVTPAPNLKHQRISRNLEFVLHQHIRRDKLGQVYYAPVDVYLGHTDVVQPDIVFVSRARSAVLSARGIEGAPDLVVEIVSPTTAKRDRGLKKQLYARHGVTHFWIVDPDAETLTDYELETNAYRMQATYHRTDRFTPTWLGELCIDLEEVFGE